jgi:RND superfamily putative drug exporter
MMSQPHYPVLPQPDPPGDDRHGYEQPGGRQHRRGRGPFVQRVAGWSARHRKTVVFGWLLLVAIVFVAGQSMGGKSVPAYDAGQSGRAEQALHGLGVTAPAVEDVLIQARAPGQTFATDPALRQAAQQVVAALARLPHAAADIRSPLGPGGSALVSRDGRSALVTFQVPGPQDQQTTAVAPAQSAVAAVQAK